MRIEEGKHYVTRGGEVYGPMLPVPASRGHDPMWQLTVKHKKQFLWTREGQYLPGKAHPKDLVSVAPTRGPTRFKCVKDGSEYKAMFLHLLIERAGGTEGEFYALIEGNWLPIEIGEGPTWTLK